MLYTYQIGYHDVGQEKQRIKVLNWFI